MSISAISASGLYPTFIPTAAANPAATIPVNAGTLQPVTPLQSTPVQPTTPPQTTTQPRALTPPQVTAAPQVTTPLSPPPAVEAPPPLNPAPSNATPSAAATSTTIAQTYGFAPSLIVPVSQVLTYQPIYANPSGVSGVSKIALTSRTSEYPRHLFDQLA